MTNNIRPTLPITIYGETFYCTPEVGRYANGRIALRLFTEEGPFATITINLPDQHLNDAELFVKDWSENEPVVAALLEAGWLHPEGREVQSGHVFPKVMTPAGALATYLLSL